MHAWMIIKGVAFTRVSSSLHTGDKKLLPAAHNTLENCNQEQRFPGSLAQSSNHQPLEPELQITWLPRRRAAQVLCHSFWLSWWLQKQTISNSLKSSLWVNNGYISSILVLLYAVDKAGSHCTFRAINWKSSLQSGKEKGIRVSHPHYYYKYW